MGHRIFPVVGWAERGGYDAMGHGNSVPRFHVTWGTGPGIVEPFERRAREAARSGRLIFKFRHRVDALSITNGTVDGVSGAILAPDNVERGKSSSRNVVGEFALKAQAVIVASGGIGGNHDLVRANWPKRLGEPPKFMISGVPEHVDGRMIGITETVRRAADQPRPHVALCRGHPELVTDLAAPRHPHPARPVLDVVRRHRHAAAGAAVPGVRYARPAQIHHVHRL